MEYDYLTQCENLGIELFCGVNKYTNNSYITDQNILHLINFKGTLNSNVFIHNSYYQTNEISTFLYQHYQSDCVKQRIINKNRFKERYDNNNDIFIHLRLGDASRFNPGYHYYETAIRCVKEYGNIFISSDTIEHEICQKIISEFNATIINYNEVDTIHFGSTCKHVILSHGSFSAYIGYFSFCV
jgi:hypothetical protein